MKKEAPLMLKAEYNANQEQKQLREEHGIKDENVVVIEKKSRIIQLLRLFGSIVQILATMLIAVLAIIGLTTLVFPETRVEFFSIANQTANELKSFLPH